MIDSDFHDVNFPCSWIRNKFEVVRFCRLKATTSWCVDFASMFVLMTSRCSERVPLKVFDE